MCKLITVWELQQCSDNELCALFQKVSQDMVQSKPGSSERRNALASMENITRSLNTRCKLCQKPPGC